MDTAVNIAHTLALAERDAGRPESALPVFLGVKRLDDIIDPNELDETRTGSYYGNVGRCLYFMGQIDQALICYQKSALLLEKTVLSHHVYNQGFIRKWLGELLVARGQLVLGGIFLRAAYLMWCENSPPRATEVIAMYHDVEARCNMLSDVDDTEIERVCLDWIFGRKLNEKYAA